MVNKIEMNRYDKRIKCVIDKKKALNLNNTSFALGYSLARVFSSNTDPDYDKIKGNLQVLALLAAFFTRNDFLQGLLIGAGIKNLPEIIDKISSEFHDLSDNLRKFQGKQKKWS